MLEREHPPGAAEAGDDFVGGEQHLVLVADRTDACEVVVLRHDHAADALHRLGKEHRHGIGALPQDRLFELVGGRDTLADVSRDPGSGTDTARECAGTRGRAARTAARTR